MKKIRIDETGNKYGKLKVIGYHSTDKHGKALWECICECGNKTKTHGSNLRKGSAKSCGCDRNETLRKRLTTHGLSNRDNKLYGIWQGIKERTCNKKNKNYKGYGGRGIKICDEWKKDYLTFHKWAINNGYIEGLTIERIDVNNGYHPDNCKWIPLSDQAGNKRNTLYLTYENETKSAINWAKDERILAKRITYDMIRARKQNGWSDEKTLSTPNAEMVIEYDGEIKTLTQWAKYLGINYATLSDRIKKHGWSIEKSFTTKAKRGRKSE